MHKLLLAIVTLALVISPLRGALAMPVMTAADGADHCAQMQDGTHSMAHIAGMQDSSTDYPDHACDQGCGGDCCEDACNACAHASIALSTTISVISHNHYTPLNITVSYGVAGRTVHPPYRPPISLLS